MRDVDRKYLLHTISYKQSLKGDYTMEYTTLSNDV